ELTFVVVGAGPTGLELAGAIADIAHRTLRHEYHHIDTTATKVLLVEGQKQVLPSYPADLAANAARQAEKLGVTIRVDTRVTQITPDSVELKHGDQLETIPTCNVFWAAGVKASALGAVVAEATGAETDRGGRLHVDGNCAVAGHPNLFVIGDLAHFDDGRETPLPGTAAVATQQGKYVAKLIKSRLRGKPSQPFRFRDLGSMATIGKAAAVCDLGRVHLTGFIAWLVWLFLHLILLVGFQNRILVLIQWAKAYVTSSRSARLITQKVGPFLPAEEGPDDG
ncbi:MAG: FAD-dependent oxidoreductase, partial [Planctomycetota bacterium]